MATDAGVASPEPAAGDLAQQSSPAETKAEGERRANLKSKTSRALDKYLSRALILASDRDSGLLTGENLQDLREDKINILSAYVSDAPNLGVQVLNAFDPVERAWEEARQDWRSRIDQISGEAQRTIARWSHTVQVSCYCGVMIAAVIAVGFDPHWTYAEYIPFLRGSGFGLATIAFCAFLVLVPLIREAVATWQFDRISKRIPVGIRTNSWANSVSQVEPREGWTKRYTRDSSIKILTPSFLIAVAGLLTAMVAIDIHMEHHLPHPEGYLHRIATWFWVGRADLGMSLVLGLAAFLIEHVLGNLSLAKENLSTTAQKAKQYSEEISLAQKQLSDLLEQAIIGTGKATSLAKGFTSFDGILAVAAKVQELGAAAWKAFHKEDRTRESTMLGVAQYVVSYRLSGMFEKFGSLFTTMSNLVAGRIRSDGAIHDRVAELYQANLLITAFESALESQDQLFNTASSNGQHFEIVAPFESLALTVNKFIEAVQNIPSEVKEGQSEIAFYTLFPLRPTEFLKRASWSGRPDNGSGAAANDKAKDWIDFLASLSKAKRKREPVIVRHFLSVHKDLMLDIAAQYSKHVHSLQDPNRIAGKPPDPNQPYEECKVRWNPLALESDRFTLLDEWVRHEINDLYVKKISDNEFPWRTAEILSGGPNAPKEYQAQFFSAGEDDAIPFGKALYEYHAEDADDEYGGALRVIKVSGDWGGKPKPDTPLELILEEEDSEWVLVDYFAGRVRETDENEHRSDRWVFAIRSHFNPEMGVVKMRLLFAGPDDAAAASRQQPDWDDTVKQLDRLFGMGGADRAHIAVVNPETGRLDWNA